MAAVFGAGPVILRGADKVCAHIPSSSDREAVQVTAVVAAVAIDPVGTALEVGRRVFG